MSDTLISHQGTARYWSSYFDEEERSVYFKALMQEIAWEEGEIMLFGQRRKIPRLQAWHGNAGLSYTYSGVRLDPSSWTPTLTKIRKRVEAASETQYNSVLLNLYRDGQDSMGWHADDEAELGDNPTIASVSFGGERMFHLRHASRERETVRISLGDGSLLIMSGSLQHHWQHQIPKTRKLVAPRINLTFRKILA